MMRGEGHSIKPTTFWRRGVTQVDTAAEVVATEPDHLRDAVRLALSSLTEEERSSVGTRLLAELRSVGLRVRESLLMLGVSSNTAGELTASEIAALIRYVRLTKPNLMMAVAEPLSELLATAKFRVQVTGKPTRKHSRRRRVEIQSQA